MQTSSRRFLPAFATAVAIVIVVIALGVIGRPAARRYLIIHADDAGMCTAVNVATIEALERGIVTSASIMVCCPGFEEFAHYAARHPEGDYGVHLTLTSEMPSFRWGPVLNRNDVPSLVSPDGTFWHTPDQVAERATLADAERELRAQIERAQASGIRLSHLDHHMWVLFKRRDLMDLYVRLGVDYKLSVRLGLKLPHESMLERDPELVAAYERHRDFLAAHGMPVLDLIDGENYDVEAVDKRAYFMDRLKELPPGVSEFVVHCSHSLPGKVLPPHVRRRMADTEIFTSPEVSDYIQELGITLINHRQISELAK